ncbi:MAG: TonB family protein [Thermodesulfobacteriota bacterium]
MTNSTHHTREAGNRTGWLTAAAAALVINLIMLSVLPVVNIGTVTLPRTSPAPRAVQFVRLKPPEPAGPRHATLAKKAPPPEQALPPVPTAVSLPPDYLDRTLRPELQAISVRDGIPQLTDMPLATIDPGVTGANGIFSIQELDRPLTAVSRMPPLYPLGARRASIEGWVEIEFLVDTGGRVEDIRIIKAQPPGVFEESVRQAVAGWRFQPGTVQGDPVRTLVTTTVRFDLEDNP